MSKIQFSMIMICFISISSIGQYREYKLDPRWKRIDGNENRIVWYDSKSLSINPGNVVRTWIRFDYSPDARVVETKKRAASGQSIKGYDKFVYRLYFWEFRCPEKEECLLRQIDYTGAGSVLGRIDFDSVKRQCEPIAPGSLGEQMLNKVCEAALTQ